MTQRQDACINPAPRWAVGGPTGAGKAEGVATTPSGGVASGGTSVDNGSVRVAEGVTVGEGEGVRVGAGVGPRAGASGVEEAVAVGASVTVDLGGVAVGAGLGPGGDSVGSGGASVGSPVGRSVGVSVGVGSSSVGSGVGSGGVSVGSGGASVGFSVGSGGGGVSSRSGVGVGMVWFSQPAWTEPLSAAPRATSRRTSTVRKAKASTRLSILFPVTAPFPSLWARLGGLYRCANLWYLATGPPEVEPSVATSPVLLHESAYLTHTGSQASYQDSVRGR